MNRKAALFISVILITQIASYSFNQITPQIDWEEPLQGDSTWEVSGRNNTTGNNTTGNSAPVISNMTISPSNAAVGDTLYCSWNYFDQDNDADQTTYWWRENGTMLAGAFGSNSPLNTSSLQVGSQIDCAGDAYDGVNWGNTISSQIVTLGSPSNSTGSNNNSGNNTGGNNSSNNTSGCGTNASNVWFEVEPYKPEWNASDTVSVYLDTYCGIWNNSYMISWGLIDNATNTIIDYGNTSFVTNTSSVSYHPNHTYHFNQFDIHLHYMETGNYTVFGQFSVWMNNS